MHRYTSLKIIFIVIKRAARVSQVFGSRHVGIVNKMLADKNSLFAMCLRRGKFAQATQIIKVLLILYL